MNPVGRTFRIDAARGEWGPPVEVVGVVRDSKYERVREETSPTAFFPITQVPGHIGAETFELRTAIRMAALLPAVQATVRGVNRDISLKFHMLARQVDDSLVQERMLALLAGFFGGQALLLAIVGLYGTLSYLVTQRQTEFGIRMALGAESGSIVRLVMGDLATVLAVSVVTGFCGALAGTKVLQKMLFGVSAHDGATMIGAVGLLVGTALVAGYFPARRATRVDPMTTLRNE